MRETVFERENSAPVTVRVGLFDGGGFGVEVERAGEKFYPDVLGETGNYPEPMSRLLAEMTYESYCQVLTADGFTEVL